MGKVKFSFIATGYDLVIVGMGAAGCFLGCNISDDKKVLVIDYRSIPRKKACSGILTRQSMAIVQDMNPPKSIFHNPVNIDIDYVDWEHDLQKSTKKGFLNSDRAKFDFWLYKKMSKKKNISISDETRLVEFRPSKDGNHVIIILEQKGKVKSLVSEHLVGCDGANSSIRKKIFKKDLPYYVAVQEVIPGKKVDKAYFIFDHAITDYYSWLIPKNGGTEIGSALKPQNVKEKFLLFKNKVEKKYGIKGHGIMESAIMVRPRNLNDICLGQKNILLCGEAAGLIAPSSAEGISYALRSAQYCAKALNEDSEDILSEYQKNSKSMLERLDKKVKKSGVLSSHKTRKELMVQN
jgi:geranylgeranyl diphosphate/geranylgeranyl-bacteriochlorophyllide a reductase